MKCHRPPASAKKRFTFGCCVNHLTSGFALFIFFMFVIVDKSKLKKIQNENSTNECRFGILRVAAIRKFPFQLDAMTIIMMYTHKFMFFFFDFFAQSQTVIVIIMTIKYKIATQMKYKTSDYMKRKNV